MPFKDLREFIARLEEEGEAIRIEDEVDCNLEAGAILRHSAEAGLPAPFFQKVKGYPSGYTIFGGIASKFSRMAIAMDMEPHTPTKELIEEYLRRIKHPIKPVYVNSGPCKDNIHIGNEVDLLEFPVPMVHDGDGGRYIGTWHVTISKDFDSDWVNWGMYRHMLHTKNAIGVFQANPAEHLITIYKHGYEPRNKPMEVAIAIGTEPISSYCAASFAPYGVSEVDVAGGIRGEPVELVKCSTIDLAVPASAEIVIEGEIRPSDEMDEGPFGEYTGYMASVREPRPVIRVKAITHRDSPIFAMSCMGIPVDDNSIASLTKSAAILEALREHGLPVTSVSVFPETAYMLAVVAVEARFANIADEIGHAVWASRPGRSIPYIIVVEDDIDPFNIAQVMHALITRCHPYRGIVKLKNTVGNAMFPWANRHELNYRIGAKAYFDCTWPKDWKPGDVPKTVSFAKSYPSEIQKKALALWHKLGY